MTGGIVQLVAYGKEDLFLTRDPQITFFKVIYRRHTNFAREEIPQFFIHDPNFGKRTSCIISPEGDLINRMALKITLPEIPKFNSLKTSSDLNTTVDMISTGGGSNDSMATKFAWIRRIGYAMIKYIEIEIKPDSPINVPVEMLFKTIHTNSDKPLLKLTRGKKDQKMYRLFANKISTDGRRIPYLKSTEINKIIKETQSERRLMVLVVCQYELKDKGVTLKEYNIYIKCEFDAYGSIFV